MRLESSKYPSMQLALPGLNNCIRNLESHLRNVEFSQDRYNSDTFASNSIEEIAKILMKYLTED